MSSIGMAGIELEPEFRKKGLGKKSYIALNDKLNVALKSENKNSLNEDSEGVWKSLVKSNLAEDKGNYYEFKPTQPASEVEGKKADIENRRNGAKLLVDEKALKKVVQQTGIKKTKEGIENIVNFLNNTFADTYKLVEYDGKELSLSRNGEGFKIPFAGSIIGAATYVFDFDINDIIDAKYDAELAALESQPTNKVDNSERIAEIEVELEILEETKEAPTEELKERLVKVNSELSELNQDLKITIDNESANIFGELTEFEGISARAKKRKATAKTKLEEKFGQENIDRAKAINENFDDIVEQIIASGVNVFFNEGTQSHKEC